MTIPTDAAPPRYVLPTRREEDRTAYLLARYLLRVFYSTTGRFDVRGAAHVPRTGPVLFTPNHASFLDPPLIGIAIARTTWYMAKEELFTTPVLGAVLPYLQAFPIRRGTADRASLRKALSLLEKGETVTIFPEGERSRDGRLRPAELGAAMIALRSRARVIPVGLEGTAEMLPPGSRRLRPGHIRVTFGPPIGLHDLYEQAGSRAALEECGDRIMGAVARLLGVPAPMTPAAFDARQGLDCGKEARSLRPVR